jgi:hypothetical protein
MVAAARKPAAKPSPLDIFIARAEARAMLWEAGEFDLHEAVDKLQADAERDSLVDEIGQDAVQAILAKAFIVDAPPKFGGSLPDPIEIDELSNTELVDTFIALCRQADERARDKPVDPNIVRLRELMADGVSIERGWHEINRRDHVAAATMQAAEYLAQQDDVERFRQWLDRHSAAERAAIQKHMEAKRCH